MFMRLMFIFLFLFTLLLFMPVMAPLLALTLSIVAAAALMRMAEEPRTARFRRERARRQQAAWQKQWTWEYPGFEEVRSPSPEKSPRQILAEALTGVAPPHGFWVPAALGWLGLGLVGVLPSGPGLWLAALGVLFTSKWATLSTLQGPSRMALLVERFRRWAYRREEQSQTLWPWAAVAGVIAAGLSLLGHAHNETRAFLIIMVTVVTCLHTLRAAGWPQFAGIREKSVEKAVEEAFLHIAREHGGAFTATDVALATDLTIPQASEILDALHTQGLVTMEVQEDGMILYSFPELVYRQQHQERLSQPVGEAEESAEVRWETLEREA